MKRVWIPVIFFVVIIVGIRGNFNVITEKKELVQEQRQVQVQELACRDQEIKGTIKKGQTLFDIFKSYNLDLAELFHLKEASASIHRLRDLHPGQPYRIVVDDNKQVKSFVYWINDDSTLCVTRTEAGFCAEEKAVEYERKIVSLGGVISGNLISSLGRGRDNLMLALQLSDIYEWDINFASDLQEGDTYRIVVEGLYRDGKFKKYGNILSAEVTNSGKAYKAYRFAYKGRIGYYDEQGRSMQKSFLKAPLSYRRISSKFTNKRFHPVLRIYRPHHGLDFSAAKGTPVSSVGEGTVVFSGYKGQYGKLVIVRHPNGWKTYYGHLSAISRNLKRGAKVSQGEVIGRVGATGMATGPHLHYEVRIRNRPVNPLTLNLPQGKPIPEAMMADFRRARNQLDMQLASIAAPLVASSTKAAGEAEKGT